MPQFKSTPLLNESLYNISDISVEKEQHAAAQVEEQKKVPPRLKISSVDSGRIGMHDFTPKSNGRASYNPESARSFRSGRSQRSAISIVSNSWGGLSSIHPNESHQNENSQFIESQDGSQSELDQSVNSGSACFSARHQN